MRLRHRGTRAGLTRLSILAILAVANLPASAQSVHGAPAGASSTGRVAPQGEPGQPLNVSGIVVGPDGAPIANASLYIYQTDHEGYYGVKPASDNRDPRLKLFLRSDARGAWSFDTIRPGSIPEQPRAVAHSFRGLGRRTGAEHLRDCLRG